MTDTPAEQLTAATELPELPPMPEPPELPQPPEQGALTDGQTEYLDSIVGDTWTAAIDGTVARWEPDVDGDGRPVARLTLKTADDLELTLEVRPPMSDDDLKAAAAEQARIAEQHDADLEQFRAERAAWEQLAGQHRSVAELREREAAQAAANDQLAADADRFRAAVDAQVAKALKAAGIDVAGADPSLVDDTAG